MSSAIAESVRCRRWRAAGRWSGLLIAVALAWPWRPASCASVGLPALSPFVVSGSILATRVLGAITLLALPILILALLTPRGFCRHACPTGWLQEILQRFRPGPALPGPRVPDMGQWLLALTIGGACLGYPLFLWLDPLALFSAFGNSWRQPSSLANIVSGLGLPLLLLFDYAFPRLWCQRLCPLGATQELLAWPRRQWHRVGQGDNPQIAEAPNPRIARRLFLGGCAGAAGALGFKLAAAQRPAPLRPPGALEEDQFPGVCVRCGNCAQVCPARIIRPDWGASGLGGVLTPGLRFEDDYCREDCHRCGEVCPSGALARLSLAEKRVSVIGVAQINLDLCLLAKGGECTACIRRCPYQAIDRHTSGDGFLNQPRLNLAACNGCGACEAVCPVRPQRAIVIMTTKAKSPRQP